MSRSAFAATLLTICFAATVGCAASTESESSDGVASHALMTDTLVGKYYERSVPPGGIARITLDSDGTYTASFDAAGTAECIAAPCLIPESGVWNTATDDGSVSLRLQRSGGAPGAASLRTF